MAMKANLFLLSLLLFSTVTLSLSYKSEQQHGREPQQQKHGRGQEEEEQQQENNPYFFDRQSFVERFQTQEGRARVLQRFSEQSNLLRGIDNYRLAILEANPNTFVLPSHFDAESVFFVIKGNGVISLVQEENNRESYNLQRGHVIRVRAGTTVYLINKDNREKLSVVQLFQSVSTPGQFQSFHGAGGRNPESFYRAFSNDVLQAAFNTPREQLDRLFGQQRKGQILRASQEQIRALSRHASRSGSHSSGPFNLLNKRPTHSNNLGQFYVVDQDDYKQLQDLDVFVSFTNISKGAINAPFFNSRATVVVFVVEGRGRLEIACPHLSRQSQSEQGRREGQQQEQEKQEHGREGRRGQQEQEQEQQEHGREGRRGQHEQEQEQQHQGQEQGDVHYQRASARLSPQTAFVIPAGHPTTVIADDNENLELVSFGINAQNNKRNYLAGKNSILNQLEREAKELSFNIPAREVDSILNNQAHQYFLPGPNQPQQREEGGRHSIIDFALF